MFRNIGRTQIQSDRGKLHFQHIPYMGLSKHIPALIKHYGNLTKEQRQNKYNFYLKEDTQGSQSSYLHLLDNAPDLKLVNNINEETMQDAIARFKNTIKFNL